MAEFTIGLLLLSQDCPLLSPLTPPLPMAPVLGVSSRSPPTASAMKECHIPLGDNDNRVQGMWNLLKVVDNKSWQIEEAFACPEELMFG